MRQTHFVLLNSMCAVSRFIMICVIMLLAWLIKLIVLCFEHRCKFILSVLVYVRFYFNPHDRFQSYLSHCMHMCISNYNRANGVAGNRLLELLMSPSSKSQYMFASEFSWIGDLFSYFWYSYFLRCGHFVEYMNMHAMNMQRWLWVRIWLCISPAGAAWRHLLMTAGTRVWTLNTSI